jgi:diaminopimelate epimerase
MADDCKPTAEFDFIKMEGLGNDYIYLDLINQTLPADIDIARLARSVSDRRRGIGGDGLILIAPSEHAAGRMIMYNADGSRAEMCGNGLRCVARFLHDAHHAEAAMTIETDAGLLTATVAGDQVTIDLGVPRFAASEIPVQLAGPVPLLDRPLAVAGEQLAISCVSFGNPHCIVFVDDVATAPVAYLGPAIETHSIFPRKTNVAFVAVMSRHRLRQRTWERGSGETHACGTGAAAALVAAYLTGRSEREVEIELLGGTLLLEWRLHDDHVLLSGPAVEVFRGRYRLS